jgi:hypothetical protein
MGLYQYFSVLKRLWLTYFFSAYQTFCIIPTCHKNYYDVRISVHMDTTQHSLCSLSLTRWYIGLEALRLTSSGKKFHLHNVLLWTVVTVRIYPLTFFCVQFHCSCTVMVRTSTEEPMFRLINQINSSLIQCSKLCWRTWRGVQLKLCGTGV